MERITKQKHTKSIFLYAFARFLERISYYGFRSLVIFYMVGKVLNMEQSEALKVYGWFFGSIVFFSLLGAILGDLIIGNKKALIIGAIIQSLGSFTLCIPSTTGLYIGLFLINLGGGLYTPNIISNFGKFYLKKTKILDAGFTILYLAVSLGAFLGVLIIGYLGETYGWKTGFIISGIIMILSIIPILFSDDSDIVLSTDPKVSIHRRIMDIIIIVVIVSSFWAIYRIADIYIVELQFNLSNSSGLGYPIKIIKSLNSVFILLLSLLASILWSFFYNNQFIKLTIGLIFGAISLGILLFIPEVSTEQSLIFYLFSLFFLSISQVYISPILYSILTKYGNPKYLAILISLTSIFNWLLFDIVFLFNEEIYDNSKFILKLGMIIMFIISISLMIFIHFRKTKTLIQQ